MELRNFGTTSLAVSALGLGGGRLDQLSDRDAESLLAAARELGVTYLDTARSYGTSESRIGRYLKHCRDSFVVSTKVGYGIDGVEDWTAESVSRGVDAALRRLQTDYIDIVYLHSCPASTLRYGGVVEALVHAVEVGKVRVAGYAGDGEGLEAAVEDPRLAALMASASLFDQVALHRSLPNAKNAGKGFVAKRPLANAPWRLSERPVDAEWVTYWDRMACMGLDPLELDPSVGDGAGVPSSKLAASRAAWVALSLRFAVYTWGVDSAVLGTTSIRHLTDACAAIRQGPLSATAVHAIRSRFSDASGGHWAGHV